MKQLNEDFFRQPTLKVAKELIGKKMSFNGCSGIIVETEAYEDDEASHASRKTPRSMIMHETYGNVYVYFIYGNYHCLNFTTRENGPGAVLIRAVEPAEGIEIMKQRRKTDDVSNLTNGPGKLCQAFGITTAINRTRIGESIKLEDTGLKNLEIISTSRIGIKKATHLDWRFYLKGSEFVSK